MKCIIKRNSEPAVTARPGTLRTAICITVYMLLCVFGVILLSSCGGGGIDIPDVTLPDLSDTEATQQTQQTQADTEDVIPEGTICIETAEQLALIGKSDEYPANGDYALVADIDLSGVKNWTPICGSDAQSGAYSGNEIFSGRFDGRGHVISGLNINTRSGNSHSNWGLFGTIAGKSSAWQARVVNLILKDVSIEITARAGTDAGALAGQVNGAVEIDNVTLLSGNVSVKLANNGDLLGAGGLIGQCRTADGSTNNNISIRNIFTAVSVYGEITGSNYVSSLIGRIRGSTLGELTDVIAAGEAVTQFGAGNALCGGDSGASVCRRVYYLDSNGERGDVGECLNINRMTSGSLKMGGMWTVSGGLLPVPTTAYVSGAYNALDFLKLNLDDGDVMNQVKESFKLEKTLGDKNLIWSSSDENTIKIDGDTATVIRPDFGSVEVTLTVTDGESSRIFALRVISGVSGAFEDVSLQPGDTLKLINYPDGTVYNWTVTDMNTGKSKTISGDTTGEYKLTKNDYEHLFTVAVDGCEDISFYFSALPVVYIDSDTDYYNVNKGNYSDATMRLQGNGNFDSEEYDGAIKIKLRGNSTAYCDKRPFNIKLDKRTDLLDLGECKTWSLLANYYDRSHLRNKLSYDLGANLGLSEINAEWAVLIYNGKYQGMYQLSEKIVVDSSRVDIFDWEEVAEDIAEAIGREKFLSNPDIKELEDKLIKDLSWVTTGKFGGYNISDYYDTSSLDIRGGYLIELDEYYDEISEFNTEKRVPIMIKEPEYVVTNDEMFGFIQNYFKRMEDALYSPDGYNADEEHYSDLIDIDSYLDFWLVNAVFKNVEVLYKSNYMYLDFGGKMTFGPIWDYDWSSGNTVNMWGASTDAKSWRTSESNDREYWYRALYDDPAFMLALYDEYWDNHDKIDDMINSIDGYYDYFKTAGEVDSSRWGYWTNQNSEVNSLAEWLRTRIKWLDGEMKTPEKFIDSMGVYVGSNDIEITDVTVIGDTATVTAEFSGDVDTVMFRFNGKYLIAGVNGNSSGGKTKSKVSISLDDIENDMSMVCVEALGVDSVGEYIINKKPSWEGASSMYISDFEYFD